MSQMSLEKKITRREFVKDLATSVAVVGFWPFFAHAATGNKAKPFIKWVGGKGQLLEQLSALLPKDIGERKNLTYVEPFVGGGAMLFYMLGTYPNIKRAIINDFNPDLTNVYRVIRDKPEDLIVALERYREQYGQLDAEEERKEFYLAERDKYNLNGQSDVDRAASFIFLNRTCFNGLYRVNTKGEFNVPFGKAKNPLICDRETILNDSQLLQKVEILTGDFSDVAQKIRSKAFFYFDPPYRPLTKTAAFTAYQKEGFNDEAQKRLAEFCRELDATGHQFLLSNRDPHNSDPNDNFFDDLYVGFDINRVQAARAINSKADGRGKISEIAIRNYKE